MDLKGAGSSLDSLVSAFSARVAELQELTIARNMYPATSIPDLAAVDSTLTVMESQVQAIKERLQAERDVIPKAKKLVELSQRQQKRLQHMAAHMPSLIRNTSSLNEIPSANYQYYTPLRSAQELSEYSLPSLHLELNDEPVIVPAKEKKGHLLAPRWYITQRELDSLSSYMRGRLTLDKVNIAINELAGYADITAQLFANPKKKISDEAWKKVLEVREIARSANVKGKSFLLESDIKGPGLKLDNTGKATITVLRHLGRIQEYRVGHHRVFILMPPTV